MFFNLLQMGGYNAYSDGVANGYSQFTSSSAFLLMIAIAIVGFFVQYKLKAVFEKYSKVSSPNGMSGREAAEQMLRDNNITNVRVVSVAGQLTDHFDPRNMTVNLSESVYGSRSISAIAVACHECGHAVQHAEAYGPLVMRSQLVPVVSFSSRMATWVIIAGMLLISSGIGEAICWVGIGMIAMSAIFSLVTLPVEYNASSRALAWLERSGVARGVELQQAKEALSWAARTYLVAAISAVATLLYYVMIIMSRRD
ncbi:MAG: zinc metallopeptidase [Rikenellaceae bacterium]